MSYYSLCAVFHSVEFPCTLAEMRKRFEEHLGQLTKGEEPGKVNIIHEVAGGAMRMFQYATHNRIRPARVSR